MCYRFVVLDDLTPEEAKAYRRLLELEHARSSPLDLAELLFPETRRWPHLELLNDYLVALCEYRLTANGPVPAGQVRWWYRGASTGTEVPVEGPHDIPEDVDEFGAYDGVSGDAVVFNLAVSMMPRAGKSRLITEVFPLWLLLHDPDVQIGLATYSDTFAGDWGEAMKNLCLGHHSEREETGASPFLPYPDGGARAAKDIFKVRGSRGKIRYTGTGGAVTGKTLHVLIADDLVKNEDDILSDATRASIQRFIDTTWSTRKTRALAPASFLPIPVEVRMATRWHRMDPIGYSCYDAETNEPNPLWCIVNIPALSKGSGDPLERPEGQAHPNAAGLTRQALLDLQTEDPRTFAALYQGSPAVEGGGLVSSDFRSFTTKVTGDAEYLLFREAETDPDSPPELVSVAKSELIVFAAADMAATKKTSSDYTVFGVFGYSREHEVLFVLDWYRKRITTDEYYDELVPLISDYGVSTVVVENVTYGQVFAQGLERRGFDVEMADAVMDKVARVVSSRVSSMIRAGRVRVPRGAVWLPGLASECALFPNDEHDDQVDVLSFAASFVTVLPSWRAQKAASRPSVPELIDMHAERASKTRAPRGSYSSRWSGLRRRS